MKIKTRKLHPAEQYAHDVIHGRIVACKYVIQACKRYFDDKKNGKKRGLYFNKNDAQHAIDFIQRYCKHSKAEWANNPFILESWQQFIIWNIFGWKINSVNGYRRFRTTYIECGRKNGKSTMMAGIGLYLFIADGEEGAEIYSAAVKREQAIISHSEATRMVKKSPELRKEVSIFKNNLSIESTNSKFEPLGRDADSCDGLNVHGALVDELHAHKTDEMWNVLQTAIGSRRQSLQITITTAGFDRNTICWQQHEYLVRILEEVGKENCYYDDSYFGIIYTIDENDNWQDESCWIKANPNLGVSVIWEPIRNNAKKAKEIPSEQNEFLRKHLCKWVQQSVRAIDMTLWDENFSHNIDEEKYLTKKCFGGLDLSSVSDLTAWIMLFPNHLNPVKLDIIGRFWCPEAQISNRQNRYRNFYEAWARDGWLITTPGDAIDYERVKFKIMSDAKKFNLVDMGIDMLFQGYQLGMELSTELGTRFDATTGKHESRVVGVGMGYKTMGPAMKEFEKRLLDRCLNHGNNPILRFCADNLAVSIDPAGNKKPNKVESQGKIDAIVATLIALDRVNRHPIQEIGSKYERSDMVVV